MSNDNMKKGLVVSLRKPAVGLLSQKRIALLFRFGQNQTQRSMNRLLTILCVGSLSIISLNASMPQPTEKISEKMGGAYAMFAGKFGGEVTQKDLKETKTIEIAGCASGSTITKYQLIIKKKGKKTVKIDGKSSQLNEEMRKELQALSAGDTFVFEYMKAKLPSGGTVDVWCKTFTVV